jgi:hypothetical protein
MMDGRRHDFFYSEFFGAVGERDFSNQTNFTDFANQFSIFSLTNITNRYYRNQHYRLPFGDETKSLME